MRNVAGALAQQRLSAALIARLRNQGTPFQWQANGGTWSSILDDDAATAVILRGLYWIRDGQPRLLRYNLNVPIVGKNIDLCLFQLRPEQYNTDAINNPANYLALGELKGGIDPAGADEHWKTARTALTRIADGFAGTGVNIQSFFIGAAIVADMANELWAMLEGNTLTNAANLTNENQLASIVRWLTTL